MIDVLLYLWITIVAFGPVYNIVGDAGVYGVLVLIVLLSRKFKIELKVIVSIFFFGLFLGIKSIGIIGTEYISAFHSARTVVTGCIKLATLFLLLPTIKRLIETRNEKSIINAFMILFHISIGISTIILFRIGRDTYRFNASGGGILLSPQFYVLISVFMSMFFTYKLKVHKGNKAINFLLLGLNALYIFAANYTTQLIFLIFGIASVIICCSNTKRINMVISMAIMTIIALAISVYLPDIISNLNSILFNNNTTVSIRLTEIERLLRRESLQGTDLMGRFDRISMSLNAFKTNIFFGLDFSKYNTRYTGLVVGGHSEWPDALARYGLVGILLFFCFLKSGSDNLLSLMKHGTNGFDISILIVMFTYGFSNPFIRGQGYILVFLIIESLIVWKKSINETNMKDNEMVETT